MATIKKHVLSCGIPVYFCIDKTKHQVYCDLYVRFGSGYRFYKDDKNLKTIPSGIAHLIEHYLCERGDVGNLLENLGPITLSCNASTGEKTTDFYFHALPKHFKEAFTLLRKSVFFPHFSEEKLSETKPAILEECRMQKDHLGRKIYAIANKNLFSKYDYVNGIGTLEEIEEIKLCDVERIYKAFYVPENMVLFLGGNLDISETILFLENELALSKAKKPKLFIPKEPTHVVKDYELLEDKVSMTEIHLYFKMPLLKRVSSLNKEQIDTYEDFIFSMNFSNESKLWKDLSDKGFIVGYLNLNYREFFDMQIVSLSLRTTQKEKAIQTILDYVQNGLCFDEGLFDNLKKRKIASLIRKNDYIENEYYKLISQVLEYHHRKSKKISDIQNYNREECEMVSKALSFQNYTIIEVIPEVE